MFYEVWTIVIRQDDKVTPFLLPGLNNTLPFLEYVNLAVHNWTMGKESPIGSWVAVFISFDVIFFSWV